MSSRSSGMNSDRTPCGPIRLQAATPSQASRPACPQSDLEHWAVGGGPLPRSLADHIRTCPACAQQVRQANRVHASFALLRTQPAPPNLLPRANSRALRMLRRAARASAAAHRLLRMRPGLTRWQRFEVHLARWSVGVAAAFILLLMRFGMMSGIAKTEATGQALVENWHRHLDPDAEWFPPQHLA